MSSGRRHGGVGGREMIRALYHWTKSSKEMRWSWNRIEMQKSQEEQYNTFEKESRYSSHARTQPLPRRLHLTVVRRFNWILNPFCLQLLSSFPEFSWAGSVFYFFFFSFSRTSNEKRGLGRHCHRILFKFFFFSQVLFEKGKIKKAFQTADKLMGERNLGRRILGIRQNKIFPRNESAISNLY